MVDEDIKVVITEVEVGVGIADGSAGVVGGSIGIDENGVYPPKTMVRKALSILESFFMSVCLSMSLISASICSLEKNLSTARSIAICPPSLS